MRSKFYAWVERLAKIIQYSPTDKWAAHECIQRTDHREGPSCTPKIGLQITRSMRIGTVANFGDTHGEVTRSETLNPFV